MDKQSEYRKRWRLKNLEHIRAYQREWRERNREKANQLCRNWRAKNPDKILEYERKHGRQYRKKNKHRHRYYCFKHKYGLSRDSYDTLLRSQDFKCASCGVNLTSVGTNNIHVDHCHDTQKIRGILCGPCNRALGLLKDDAVKVRKLADYIARFN